MAEKKAYLLRLDAQLHDSLQKWAADELRSVNAQIEVLLREALGRRGVKVARPEQRRRGRPPKEE